MRKWKVAGAARNRMCALLLAFAMLVSMPVTASADATSADATSADEYETYTLGDLYMQIDDLLFRDFRHPSDCGVGK